MCTQPESQIVRPKYLSGDRLAAFVVGLIDGDGSFQVNHWRNKYLQYRLVVKLKYNEYNKDMLEHIASAYGGQVNIVTVVKTKAQFVQWTINDAKVITNKILPLFTLFPPLTTRMTLQVAFLNKALSGMTVNEYMLTRGNKYAARKLMANAAPLFTTIPIYFDSWLSGFIEAEGSFASRSGSIGFSFSIGQLFDLYLLRAILDYLGQQHLTVQLKGGVANVNPFYFIEVANTKGVEKVVQHLVDNPLQGYKYYQLAVVMKESKAFSHLRYQFWTN